MGQLIWFCLMSRTWFRHLNSWSNCLLYRKKISTFFSKSQHLKKDCCDLTKNQMIWPIIVHILVTNKFIFFFNSFGTARWNLSCFCPLSSYCTCIWYTTKEWQRVTIVIWALQHVSNIETPISLLRDISLAHLFSLYLKVSSLYRKKK